MSGTKRRSRRSVQKARELKRWQQGRRDRLRTDHGPEDRGYVDRQDDRPTEGESQ